MQSFSGAVHRFRLYPFVPGQAREKLEAEKAELEQKAAPNGKETTDDKKSSGVVEGSGSAKEAAAEKDRKAEGNGKADVVAEQSNGAEADGSARNGAEEEEEEGFPEHFPGEIRHTLRLFLLPLASNVSTAFYLGVLHEFAEGLDG